ncbi:MAG: DUF4836 family protein [Chitinophagaceae bacterium]
MNFIRRSLLATIILIQAFCLHAQKNPLHAYLPADAKTIININLRSIASKLKWQEIQRLSFFEESLKDAPLSMQELLKDPASSGINFKSDLFIVFLPDPENKTKPIPVLYGQLADPGKFAVTIQKIAPGKKIQSTGKMKIFTDGKNTFAWTSGMFVGPISKNKSAAAPLSKTGKKVDDTKAISSQAKQLIKQFRSLLTPVKHPITDDSRFIELLKEDGDIRFWINRSIEKPKGKGNKDDVLKMMNLGLMQQGNYMAAILRFENGKAVMQMKSYMNNTMDSLYRLYPATKLNSSILKKLPAGQPVALLSFSMSPGLVGAMLQASGTEKIVDSFAKQSPVRPMEIVEGLNGDITLAVIKAIDYDEKDTVTAALKGFQVFLAASVKNKSKLEPLLNLLNKPKKVKTDSEGNEIKPSGPLAGVKPVLLLNDSFLVVSISSFAAEKFLNTVGDNDIFRVADAYTGYPSLFSLDLKTIFNYAMKMSGKKNSSDEGALKVLDAFERLVFYGGKYDNGAALSTAELQFGNKEENSLKQFIKVLEMAATMEMKKKKSKSAYGKEGPAPSEEMKNDEIVEPAAPAPPKPKNKIEKDK